MTALVACLTNGTKAIFRAVPETSRRLLDSTAALIAQVVLYLILRRRAPQSSPQFKVS